MVRREDEFSRGVIAALRPLLEKWLTTFRYELKAVSRNMNQQLPFVCSDDTRCTFFVLINGA